MEEKEWRRGEDEEVVVAKREDKRWGRGRRRIKGMKIPCNKLFNKGWRQDQGKQIETGTLGVRLVGLASCQSTRYLERPRP